MARLDHRHVMACPLFEVVAVDGQHGGSVQVDGQEVNGRPFWSNGYRPRTRRWSDSGATSKRFGHSIEPALTLKFLKYATSRRGATQSVDHRNTKSERSASP